MSEARSRNRRFNGLDLVVLPLGTSVLIVGLDRVFPSGNVPNPLIDPRLITAVIAVGMIGYVAVVIDIQTPPRHSSIHHSIGLANSLTVLRGGFLAIVGGFVVVSPESDPLLAWGPALCYGAAVLLDWLDGIVARTIGQETDLGQRLDMAFDSFGFVVAPLVAVVWGQLPAYYLSLSAARYVYLGGKAWRRWRGQPVYHRLDSDVTRYLAAIQMVFITIVLFPTIPPEPVWLIAPVLLTPSLAVFIRDYLYVSGRLPVSSGGLPSAQ